MRIDEHCPKIDKSMAIGAYGGLPKTSEHSTMMLMSLYYTHDESPMMGKAFDRLFQRVSSHSGVDDACLQDPPIDPFALFCCTTL